MSDALRTVLLELERHLAGVGWDIPARLYALVHTDRLLAEEPGLAETLGLRGSAAGAPADALTGIEQDFAGSGDLLDDLAGIVWPPTVYGCAVAVERTFLPAGLEAELSAGADPAAFVAAHPRREEVRVVVGVDRSGARHGIARLRSRSDHLLAADDLVPDLAAALAHTLADDA
ncbi:MAG: PPA1309 family protein [Actinomycetes bacterium]